MGPANSGEATNEELVKKRDISSWLAEAILHLLVLKERAVSLGSFMVKENNWTELVMDKISKMDWAARGEE